MFDYIRDMQDMQVVVCLRYVLLFWVVLTPLNRSTSLSAMFDYIRVPPKESHKRARA